LKWSERGIARDGHDVFMDGKAAGQVTSGSPAPFLKKILTCICANRVCVEGRDHSDCLRLSVRKSFRLRSISVIAKAECEFDVETTSTDFDKEPQTLKETTILNGETSQRNCITSKDHEWVKVEGEIGTVGITDHAQNSLRCCLCRTAKGRREFQATRGFLVSLNR